MNISPLKSNSYSTACSGVESQIASGQVTLCVWSDQLRLQVLASALEFFAAPQLSAAWTTFLTITLLLLLLPCVRRWCVSS
jgi:hypothetical protein